MKRKIPNILSLLRVLIAPVFFVLFISGDIEKIVWATLLFFVGGVTDYLDGWLARKMKATSSWGRFVDPLADKFLTTGAFFGFVYASIIPMWMVVIIIVRDFATTFLRVIAKSEKPVKTSYPAKAKTFLQMAFISAILILLSSQYFSQDNALKAQLIGWVYSDLTYYVMLGITLISIWTLIDYLKEMYFPAKENVTI